jgi:cytochrome oxidase Cu insertion factor (SCO1/SenC/PrrC family)
MKRGLVIFTTGLVVLLVGLTLTYFMRPADRPTGATTTGEVQIGGPFTLVDHTGRTVTDADYRGNLMLVFFGFTHCPDVCPTTLQEIASALDVLADEAGRVQPLFVTVDPERDTPEVMAEYVDLFHPRIVGLTGTVDQVKAVAKAYRVYFNKVPQGDTYTMDHSAITYLMGPDGGFLTHFSRGTTPEEMAETIRHHVAETS